MILYLSLGFVIGVIGNSIFIKFKNRCEHDWDVIEEGKMHSTIVGGVVGRYQYLQCKKCKKPKEIKWNI